MTTNRVSRALSVAVIALTLALPAQAQSGYEALIYDACARHGCNGDQLVRVMYCESEGNPYAVNPLTGDTGLMQFNPQTWEAWSLGYFGYVPNIYDAAMQIELAAWAWANGLGHHWVCDGS